MKHVPAALIASRFVFGPLQIWVCVNRGSPPLILSILLLAMLSDIFDGVIARRLGIATAPLRVADSRADAWFFCCVGLSIWLTDRDLLHSYVVPISTEIFLQIASYTYDLIRYRRIASLHAYSTKIWGFSLYLAVGALLAFHWGALIWVSFSLGIVSFLDGLAIKLILPGWHHDVKSFVHARKLVLLKMQRVGVRLD